MSKTYYGFSISNRGEEPAWFHTPEAAARFNEACGGIFGSVEETTDPDPADIGDSETDPWTNCRPS